MYRRAVYMARPNVEGVPTTSFRPAPCHAITPDPPAGGKPPFYRNVPPAPPGTAGRAPDEILIPFVAAYVDRVDLSGRCIHVDWQVDY